MAAMTTVLTTFDSGKENVRTSTLAGHAAVKPRLVIEKRKLPSGAASMVEQSCKIVLATEDTNGVVLQNKVSIEIIARYPIAGESADVTAALAYAKDIIAGNEFASSIVSQNWM